MTTGVATKNLFPPPAAAAAAAVPSAASLIAELSDPIFPPSPPSSPSITNRDAAALHKRRLLSAEGAGQSKRLKNVSGNPAQDPSITLLDACRKGQLPTVREAMKAGAKVGFFSDRGFNAMHEAAFEGHLPVVRFLVDECSVDPTLPAEEHEATALHLASAQNRVDVVRYFVGEKMLSLSHQDQDGANSFDLACANDADGVVRYFFEERGVTRNATDENENSTLHHVSAEGSVRTVTYMLTHPSSWSLCLKRNADHQRPIDLALKENQSGVVDAFISFYTRELTRLCGAPLHQNLPAFLGLLQFHSHLLSNPKTAPFLKSLEPLHLKLAGWLWGKKVEIFALVKATIKGLESDGASLKGARTVYKFLFQLQCFSQQRVPTPEELPLMRERLHASLSLVISRNAQNEMNTLAAFLKRSQESDIFALLTNSMGYCVESTSLNYNQNCLSVLGRLPQFIAGCGLTSGADLEAIGYDFTVDYWIDRIEAAPIPANYTAAGLAVANLEKRLLLLPKKVGNYHLAEALAPAFVAFKNLFIPKKEPGSLNSWCKKARELQASICHALIRAFLHQFDAEFSVEILSTCDLQAQYKLTLTNMFQLRTIIK